MPENASLKLLVLRQVRPRTGQDAALRGGAQRRTSSSSVETSESWYSLLPTLGLVKSQPPAGVTTATT